MRQRQRKCRHRQKGAGSNVTTEAETGMRRPSAQECEGSRRSWKIKGIRSLAEPRRASRPTDTLISDFPAPEL